MARNTVSGRRRPNRQGVDAGAPDVGNRSEGAAPVARYRRKGSFGSGSGFTFIEMVIVVSMLAILVAIAVPVYQSQVLASKESVLRHNLAIIRERLDQYKADQGKYPTSLDELVEKEYLREIPEDPIMGDNLWEEIYEDYDPDQPEEELGIYDVRSLSSDIGMNGQPYSEW